jgi:hypothetical protein
MSKKKIKVAICVPCRDELMSGFCFDLAKLVQYEALRGKVEVHLLQMQGTLIFTQRERLGEEALKWGADYLMWVDSDMRFPKDTLEEMLKHNVDIVGVNATTRREPIKPTAVNLVIKNEEEHSWIPIDSLNSKGIEKCTAVGFGLTVIKADVFKKVSRPWFNVIWSDHGAIIGEDIHFCIKCQDTGYDVYVDHDTSRQIGHIGTRSFGWKDIQNGTLDIQRPKDNSSELPGKV